MKKWGLLFLVLMLVVDIAIAYEECQSEVQPNDIPCRVTTTWVYPEPCNSYNTTIFNEAGGVVYTTNLSSFGETGFCNFTFTNTTPQSYYYNISSGDTGGILVKEDDTMGYMALGLILMGATMLFAYFAVNSKNYVFQIFFSLFAFMMIVVDFYMGARIIEAAVSTQTGLIHNIDTMYMVSLYLFKFLLSLIGIYVMFKLWNLIFPSKDERRRRKEEQWIIGY